MKHFFRLFCIFASFLLPCAFARAEAPLSVCVNEICASNGGHCMIRDSSPDYIELFNRTDQALSLDGFFISDDEDHLQKFSLDGYDIPENGYLILAADKKELPFKLSASGGDELFLSDAEGHILQRVSLPPLEKDETYSLQENGEWQITDPTPLKANAEGVPYMEKVYVASPRFSHTAGFYDAPFDLTLEGYKTYRLYYTTDGSVPDENSTLYTGPIHIEDATDRPNILSARTDIATWTVTPPSDPVKKATIIRAVAVDPDGNRSSVVTNTFFVGFQNYEAYQDIPILSIVADPYDLFDEDDGIYVLGKNYREWLEDENRDAELAIIKRPANFMMRGKEWEIPAAIQWFEKDNSLRLTQEIGMRIHGNYSRDHAKKSFNLYARKEYGSNTFQYDILAGLSGKKKLVVRENLGRDSMIHALLQETGLPASPYTPCLVFLNGEFWGFYEIREKQDENDIAAFYGLNPDDLLVIKNGELNAGKQPEEIKLKGSKAVYRYLLSRIRDADASTAQGYAYIDSLIDVDDYITSIAANAYINNTDYKANQTLWRTAETGEGEYEDGRWRWIFQDLDNCASSSYSTDRASFLLEDEIFASLWKSSEFQIGFLTRIMDFANVELTPEYVQEFVTPVMTYYNQYILESNIRYPNPDESPVKNPGKAQLSILTSFFRTRRETVIKKLTESLSLTCGASTLTLANLTEGIALEINGHQAHLYSDSWTGIYFKGCTVSFAAGDIPGFEFAGWYAGDEMISAEKTVAVSTDADLTLTPVYKELPVIAVMNEKEILYGAGSYGFYKSLSDSFDECSLRPDAALKVDRRYVDSAITFHLDASVREPQGITLSVPLHNYLSVGGVFTLSLADGSAPIQWTVRVETGENTHEELQADSMTAFGGKTILSFAIPEKQVEDQAVVIRLEAEAEEGPASFVLNGFRVYGVPMGAALGQAHEYARCAGSLGAEEEYLPDFESMADWSDERIEAETAALRERLQAAMAEKAVTTVGEISPSRPSWEGLGSYPAILVDEKLTEAFYNKAEIDFGLSFPTDAYLYEATGQTLLLEKTLRPNERLSLDKRQGIFFFLDRPVEDCRRRIAFDTAPISDDMLANVFCGFTPTNYLWMDVECYTQYQEETETVLPESWLSQSIFIYREENGSLTLYAEKTAADGALRLEPVSGRYLLLDEPLEAFAEHAAFIQKEMADRQQERALKEQRSAKVRTLLTVGGCLVLAGSAVAGILVLRKKKKR